MAKILDSRVVVTGGAGFIGSHLVDRLLSGGNEVTVVDDFSIGHRGNLAHHSDNPRLHIEKADVLDEGAMVELHRGARFVFHLAARNIRLNLRRPTIVHEVNTNGTLNVLKASAAARVERFMYCSSSEVTGDAGIVPMPEACEFKPKTIYGASKLAGEYYTQVFHRAGWLNTVIARPHNNYGPRAHYAGHAGEVIPRFIINALAGKPLPVYGDGTQTRDFTYVTETADFMVKLMEHDGVAGGTFNICRGEEVSVTGIAKLILELTGSDAPIERRPDRPSDILRLFGDPSRLKRVLKEIPTISIRDGLALTIDWFERNVSIDEKLLSSIKPENWADVEPEQWMVAPEAAKQSETAGKKRRIPLTVPKLGDEEANAARGAILSGWVTQGPRVLEFEEAFASHTRARHACAVSSCTAALHLALTALGVRPGDVVLTVSHSFIATANAIRHCQAEPVFIDIDPDTLNMDPDLLARSLEKDFEKRDGALWYGEADRLAVGESPLRGRAGPIGRLAGILVVHQAGMPADIARIMDIAGEYGVPVAEDAACAAGSEIRAVDAEQWEKIGRPHGDVACFSFHPRKIITTGEGGIITTSDPRLDGRLRLLRHQGMSVSDLERHGSSEVVFEDYVTTGFNYRMTDIQAAVGIEQLKRLDEIVARRRFLADGYAELLDQLKGLKAPREPAWARTNRQSYIVQLDDASLQRKVMQELRNRGIGVGRGIMCAHLEPPYSSAWPRGCLPRSERARDCGLTLPLYPDMDEKDLETVVDALRSAIGK